MATEVQMFKAARKTNRWNANQRVWIRFRHANHLNVWFRFRGKGRYVSGIVDRFSPSVGSLSTIEVSDAFAARITA